MALIPDQRFQNQQELFGEHGVFQSLIVQPFNAA
jgi:hypothetical protein